jgi:prefoldin beta subunit
MKRDTKIDQDILEYENLEKQLEVVLIQKHQLQLQLNEVKHASEELKKAKGAIYRSIGSIMMLSDRAEAEKELKDRQELLEVKLNAQSKQEEKLRDSVMSAQKSLQERMKDYGAAQPGA